MLDTIGGEKIAVPLGAGENNQTGLIRLNEVGAFLWEKLMEGTTEEDLVQDVTKQYEVGTEKAAGDVKKIVTISIYIFYWCNICRKFTGRST